jgi:hypothetical protein
MFKTQPSGASLGNNDQTVPEIENLPVRTMQKDLADLENPKIESFRPTQDTIKNFAAPKLQNAMATQSTSPFLGSNLPKPAQSTPITPVPKPTMPNQSPPDPFTVKKTSPSLKEESLENQTGIGKKSIAIIFSILISLIIAGSGYYFWAIKQSTLEDVNEIPFTGNISTEPITEIPPEPATESEATPITKEPTEFSPIMPNYLPLDLADTKENITAKIFTDYAGQVARSTFTTPVEFIVADLDNNPIGFPTFASKLDISLSSDIMAQLEPSFSLFIHHIGNGENRIGLTVGTSSASALKSALLKNEAGLISALEPLFTASYDQKTISPAFQASSYNGTEIRYRNITGPETLSLDYAIYNNQLIIGTTKITLRSLIDRKTEPVTEDTSISSPIMPKIDTDTSLPEQLPNISN